MAWPLGGPCRNRTPRDARAARAPQFISPCSAYDVVNRDDTIHDANPTDNEDNTADTQTCVSLSLGSSPENSPRSPRSPLKEVELKEVELRDLSPRGTARLTPPPETIPNGWGDH